MNQNPDQNSRTEYEKSGENTDGNPFDQKCRNAHKKSVRVANHQVQTARRKIRALRLPRAEAGTVIRGGLAVAGEIFESTRGDKWLIVASDMLPSHAWPPRPAIALGGVHVVVLFACRQPVAICQTAAQQLPEPAGPTPAGTTR